ncbi:glycosyltransferase family 2 protein [Streptomyces sp. NPDC047130]|uniref:glycosyltransferase family 2 protein n=1 Tax=Streptomyces sp. NPDC047130 TaxID=3155261 RepID=UPI0033F3E0C5
MTSTPQGAAQDFGASRNASPRRAAAPHHGASAAGRTPATGTTTTTGVFRRLRRSLPAYDYEHYSRLAGPLTRPDPEQPYRVRYRSLLSQEPHRVRVSLMLLAAPLLSVGLLVWLLQPSHWTERDYPTYAFLPALDVVMLVSIGLIELFRCANVLSNAHATLVARDPVPVVPETGTRVAFLTSFVPGKEPLAMVTRTLEAAVRIRHRGVMHVWLLDEGDDPEVKEVCARLGVRHFSRKGVERWNTAKGPHRARTKHGNYNAWLDAHGGDYDFFASVDTDHVPLPNYLERMLGFFRDPDVGFVIGPQVYGNYDTFVTKAAESQQFLFHALIQRAGNRYGAPMFVGTSNAVRISALRQIGGLYDSITEDMATGFEIHRHRNPATGRKWRSVYTPDVLAVGEGPNSWTDFFTQQLRWSRGTYETILKQYAKGFWSLPPGKLFNYTMMIIFYPVSALNWILAALSCALFMGLGASGVNIDPVVWLMLYGNASALQIGLYVWNRRHNVSPHEPEGSGGVAGMVMSALSAPVYARSLLDAVLRRRSRFVVTPKGDSASPDTLFGTFRIHLFFITVFGAAIGAGFWQGHAHPAMVVWASFALLITALPIVVWRLTLRQERRRLAAPRPAPAPVPGVAATTATRVAPPHGTPAWSATRPPIGSGAHARPMPATVPVPVPAAVGASPSMPAQATAPPPARPDREASGGPSEQRRPSWAADPRETLALTAPRDARGPSAPAAAAVTAARTAGAEPADAPPAGTGTGPVDDRPAADPAVAVETRETRETRGEGTRG